MSSQVSGEPAPLLADLDAFDLPEWLGEGDVDWTAASGLRTGHLVSGLLRGADAGQSLACDLLAVDEAFPRPVADEAARVRAHQAWRHGQVLLVRHDDRLALAAPGTRWSPEDVLDALSRLARAVGASPERYAVRLRIGEGP